MTSTTGALSGTCFTCPPRVSCAPAGDTDPFSGGRRKILGVLGRVFVPLWTVSFAGVPLVTRLVSIGGIFFRRSPREVFNPVVGIHAVEVSHLRSGERSGTDKSGGHEGVDFYVRPAPVVPPKYDLEVPFVVGAGFHPMTGSELSPRKNLPVSRDLVSTKSGYRESVHDIQGTVRRSEK